MQCPQCSYDIPPHAQYCLQCGIRLVLTCDHCSTELPPNVKFCSECGRATRATAPQPDSLSPRSYAPKDLRERILTSLSLLERERKQVTVLFADLTGSVELLADRDPEDARTLLGAVVERMMEAVYLYEGTVNHVIGDGIMHSIVFSVGSVWC